MPKMPSTFSRSLRISFLSPDKLKTFYSIALMVLLESRCWGTRTYINSLEIIFNFLMKLVPAVSGSNSLVAPDFENCICASTNRCI